jgi:hypothetical protein
MNLQKRFITIVLFACAIAMSGCGGGGGSNTDSTTPSGQQPNNQETVINGKA